MDDGSLADLQAIVALKARYCRLVDTKRWDDWRELFTEDARMEVTPAGDTIPRARFVPMVVGLVSAMRTVHQCSMPEIAITGPGLARGTWAYRYELEWGDAAPELPFNQLPGQHGYVELGHYEETYVRQAGRWRISFLRTAKLAGWALVGGESGMVALP